MRFESSVLNGIATLSKHIKPYRHMCFMLTGYNTTFEEDMYRFQKLKERNIRPYVMVYNENKTDLRLNHFKRWVNSCIYTACDWMEYEPWIKSQKQIALFA